MCDLSAPETIKDNATLPPQGREDLRRRATRRSTRCSGVGPAARTCGPSPQPLASSSWRPGGWERWFGAEVKWERHNRSGETRPAPLLPLKREVGPKLRPGPGPV